MKLSEKRITKIFYKTMTIQYSLLVLQTSSQNNFLFILKNHYPFSILDWIYSCKLTQKLLYITTQTRWIWDKNQRKNFNFNRKNTGILSLSSYFCVFVTKSLKKWTLLPVPTFYRVKEQKIFKSKKENRAKLTETSWDAEI